MVLMLCLQNLLRALVFLVLLLLVFVVIFFFYKFSFFQWYWEFRICQRDFSKIFLLYFPVFILLWLPSSISSVVLVIFAVYTVNYCSLSINVISLQSSSYTGIIFSVVLSYSFFLHRILLHFFHSLELGCYSVDYAATLSTNVISA